ncbi:hypothetical protein [Halobaculum limi]|uniref:hypothetical protein n=1 Tax=Halobaculum limi TaxID=3031916 RepID=UPI002406C297|nr:hypothetical protein [Halobaculum sp. YSMS11]
MRPRSRRSVLAAAGATLLGGCLGGGPATETADPTATAGSTRTPTATEATAEPFDGPPPLGRDAVPEGAAAPPAFADEHTFDGSFSNATDVAPRGDGASVLLTGQWGGGTTTATLVDVTADGRPGERIAVEDLPTSEILFHRHLGDRTVVGGYRRDDDTFRTWLRGIETGARVFETDLGERTVVSDVAVVDSTLVAAGVKQPPDDSNGNGAAVLLWVDADGTVARRVTFDTPDANERFWAVTPTTNGYLAGGSRSDDVWVVAVDHEGTRRWERRVRRGTESYIVEGLAVGDTGTYAVARTEQYATGDNHVLLLALDPGREGAVEWTRVFDPNADETRPGELFPAAIVDDGGPRLAGHTRGRIWLGATDPDGAVRWAGYHRFRADEHLQALASVVDGRLICHGRSGSYDSDSSTPTPWVGWQ